MNKNITRFFQGLTLTTFSMGVYNTINVVLNRKNMGNNQDILNDINKNIKEKSTGQVDWQRKIEDRLDLINSNSNISQSHVDMISKTKDSLKEDVSVYQSFADRFKDYGFIEKLTPDELVKLLNEFKNKGENLASSGEKVANELSKILDDINKSNCGKYISDISDFLSSLTFEQNVAIVNVTGCIVIIFSLISLFGVFYGNILMDKLHLEKSYPKIARFIQWRRKFQFYYSLIDFFLIFSVASTIICINILIYVQ
jgi:5'-3' exonuclease